MEPEKSIKNDESFLTPFTNQSLLYRFYFHVTAGHVARKYFSKHV